MKLTLLCGDAQGPAEGLVVHWDLDAVPAGRYSAPRLAHEKLLRIRAEHAAWAFQTGMRECGGASLASRLCCGADLSMWWTSLIYERHPRMTPWLYEVYKLRALELFCAEQGVGRIELVGGDKRLERVLGDFCRRSGRGFARAHGAKNAAAPRPLVRRVYEFFPAPLRALARYCGWLWSVRRRLPRRRRQAVKGEGRALVVAYFPNIDLHEAARGRFVSRYWESLHHLLHEEARRLGGQFVNWLFIRFPQPGLSFGQCIALRDKFRAAARDGASFNYLEEFLTHGDLWSALLRWLRLCAASARIERRAAREFHFAASEVNFWEYARGDWAESFRGWRSLERCLHYLAFLRQAREAGPLRFTLFPLENCPWERMLTVAARKIPGSGLVAGAQHSSVRPTDFRYFDDPATFAAPECALFQPDLFCANGKSAAGQWLDFGMPRERLREVEALRYLYLAKDLRKESEIPVSPPSLLPPQPGEPLDDGPQRKLLVLASFFRGESEKLCGLLAAALQSGLLDGWSVTVKPHPYLPVRETLARLLGASVEKLRFAEGSLATELVRGIVVLAANSTTAALEAALRGLPLMVMRSDDDFDLCPIQNAPHLARVSTLEEFGAYLENLAPARLPPGYLDLDESLPAWRRLLAEWNGTADESKRVDVNAINGDNGQKEG